MKAVLHKLADLYEESAAGRHGGATRDFQPDFMELMQAAGCTEGDAHELAERDLRAAEDLGLVVLEYDRPRARTSIFKVRLPIAKEQPYFDYLGRRSPTQLRAEWAQLFAEASTWPVPQRFADSWRRFCAERAESAFTWRGMKPFERNDLAGGRQWLLLIPPLLAWEGRHLVRWASSLLCGDSKWLERRQKTMETLLAAVTDGSAPTYESLGILPVPPGVTFHGPIRIRLGQEWHDYRGHQGEVRLSGADISRITAIESNALRCLTVENWTPFKSLVALGSGELLVHTSYPNEATLGLLRALSRGVTPPEFWHFGDTDPKGFHILADLRARSGIAFGAFHMSHRIAEASTPLTGPDRALTEKLCDQMPAEREALEALLATGCKGDYEQESLRPPPLATWPFYPGSPYPA